MVENKGLSATIHYRLVPREQHPLVSAVVFEELGRLPPGRLEVHQGQMALELRPAIDWNKGTAARWLLDRVLGDRWSVQASVIYAGDDATDEDAFAALAGPVITLRVGSDPQSTIARYMLRDVADVGRLLDTLGEWMEARALLSAEATLGGLHEVVHNP